MDISVHTKTGNMLNPIKHIIAKHSKTKVYKDLMATLDAKKKKIKKT